MAHTGGAQHPAQHAGGRAHLAQRGSRAPVRQRPGGAAKGAPQGITFQQRAPVRPIHVTEQMADVLRLHAGFGQGLGQGSGQRLGIGLVGGWPPGLVLPGRSRAVQGQVAGGQRAGIAHRGQHHAGGGFTGNMAFRLAGLQQLTPVGGAGQHSGVAQAVHRRNHQAAGAWGGIALAGGIGLMQRSPAGAGPTAQQVDLRRLPAQHGRCGIGQQLAVGIGQVGRQHQPQAPAMGVLGRG